MTIVKISSIPEIIEIMMNFSTQNIEKSKTERDKTTLRNISLLRMNVS